MINTTELTCYSQTIREIFRLAEQYKNDIAEYSRYTLNEFFDIVSDLPYIKDPANEEFVQRPIFTLKQIGYASDCDDKCVCMLAYAFFHNYPCRVVIGSMWEGEPAHHVYCEIYFADQWIICDPTYPMAVMGVPDCNFITKTTYEAP